MVGPRIVVPLWLNVEIREGIFKAILQRPGFHGLPYIIMAPNVVQAIVLQKARLRPRTDWKKVKFQPANRDLGISHLSHLGAKTYWFDGKQAAKKLVVIFVKKTTTVIIQCTP